MPRGLSTLITDDRCRGAAPAGLATSASPLQGTITGTRAPRVDLRGRLRAGSALAFAFDPGREHAIFRVVARLPAARPIVRVRPAAVGMQRLEQKTTLLGVARNDQPGDRLERPSGFLVGPLTAALRGRRDPKEAKTERQWIARKSERRFQSKLGRQYPQSSREILVLGRSSRTNVSALSLPSLGRRWRRARMLLVSP